MAAVASQALGKKLNVEEVPLQKGRETTFLSGINLEAENTAAKKEQGCRQETSVTAECYSTTPQLLPPTHQKAFSTRSLQNKAMPLGEGSSVSPLKKKKLDLSI